MGCFDTIILRCPSCRSRMEIQSKAGPCNLDTYTLSSCPPAILGDLHDYTDQCVNCNRSFVIKVQCLATVEDSRDVEDSPEDDDL